MEIAEIESNPSFIIHKGKAIHMTLEHVGIIVIYQNKHP
jgi:hypothetical protein